MAKKKSANLFESHIEKAALAIGVILLVWIVLISVAGRPTINDRSISEAASDAAERASRVLEEMRYPDTDAELPSWTAQGELIVDQPIAALATDQFPLYPPLPKGRVEEGRQYRVPTIRDLAVDDVELLFTRATAFVTTGDHSAAAAAGYGGAGTEEVREDVDFVTVEADFKIGELRDRFQQAFVDQAEKPLEHPSPVLAMVELQHQRLLPNGQWSEYETVPRLRGDDMASKDLTLKELFGLSQAQFEVLQAERRKDTEQIQLYRPSPYALEGEEWLSLSQAEAKEEQEREERRAGAGAGRDRRDRSPRSRRSEPSRPSPTPAAPSAGMPTLPGMGPSPSPGAARQPSSSKPRRASRGNRYDPIADVAMLEDDEITLWAHDEHIIPGEVYRYRIRLGFFNPIAGHDWFVEDQYDLKGQRVLWTDWVEADKVVKVPEKTAFFPKLAGGMYGDDVRVDVFHWKQGRWYSKTFQVSPGSMIGELAQVRAPQSEDRAGGEEDAEITVDFRTGAFVIDVLPELTYWYKMGAFLKDTTTAEIIYEDSNGVIRRLAIDKRAWPEELQNLYNTITRAVRDQEKEADRGRSSRGR